MTNTEIKANIDLHITNKNTNKSISNIDVGNDIKSIVDYVVQENKIKTLKTTITQSQILQLNSTPIVILDSSGTGNIKYPINIYIKRLPGNAYTLSNNYADVINDLSNSIEQDLMLATVLTETTTGMTASPISAPQHIFYNDRNNLYKLRASSGNPVGGTGGIEVYVTYIEIIL